LNTPPHRLLSKLHQQPRLQPLLLQASQSALPLNRLPPKLRAPLLPRLLRPKLLQPQPSRRQLLLSQSLLRQLPHR